jgi:hypothetical protein
LLASISLIIGSALRGIDCGGGGVWNKTRKDEID